MRKAVRTPTGAKKRDYWWTVFFTDPLAAPIVELLVRRKWLDPDRISILALGMGLAVGPAFSVGSRTMLVVGGVIFYLAFLIDCVDGKLARALAATTPRGAALDRLSDGGRRASASLGLIVGLWRSEDGAGSSFWWAVVYTVSAYYFLELSGVEAPIQKTTGPVPDNRSDGRLAKAWLNLLTRHRLLPTPGMPDVQAVVFILGPITGAVVPGLAVGTGMVCAGLLISARRRLT